MKISASTKAVLLAGVLAVVIFPFDAFPGEWRVTPIRLDFGREVKTGVVTVTNDASERLNLQMKAMEWSQDAEGKDVYSDTSDIIFFPKIMTIDNKEDRIIRAGIKAPAVAREKTYRLFIEEIPEPRKAEGASVAVAIKFGVPIFVKPLKEEEKGEIRAIGLHGGVFSATLSNTGNVHFRINSLTIQGKNSKGEETYKTELAGWYLLSGSSRIYTSSIPKESCDRTAKVEVEAKADKFVLNGKLDVDKTMCSP